MADARARCQLRLQLLSLSRASGQRRRPVVVRALKLSTAFMNPVPQEGLLRLEPLGAITAELDRCLR